MAKLIYSSIVSLDGYTEDESGSFEWAAPDEEVHAFINDLERPIGTYLYGRRMYETMRYWETAHEQEGQSEIALDYASVWRSAEKIVYSTTLGRTTTAKTRLEREFDPVAVAELKRTMKSDITVGGPGLAGTVLAAGLVDEMQMFFNPVVVGGGKPALPAGLKLDLELLDERSFANGAVFVNYRVT